ncbi:hypothetical protein [Frigoribacterium faeni]|uniref:hypothetical protein n=1 Tax=Frigoribacterium faeni TaxID=145483 RepID=UPI0024134D6F|nr:hypothetical protein [Frigoribacterium faeni]
MSSPTSSGPSTGTSCPVAVLLPGTGYGVKAPLLYWPALMLRQLGWQVEAVEWDARDLTADDSRRVVEERLQDAAEAVGGRVDLVLAKSFGTLALPWAVEHGVAGVWLTPVLTEPVVLDALTRASSSHLAVGGGADSMWQPARGLETHAGLVTVDGADHGLLVDDWATSFDAHRAVLTAIETHIKGLG